MSESIETTSHSKRPAIRRLGFPSAAAAALVGAICVPLAAGGMAYLERLEAGGLAVFAWMVAAFFAPMILATWPWKQMWTALREGTYFQRSWPTEKNLAEFYVPAWGRMLLFFVFGVATTAAVGMLLK